ncbi:MAG TPA: LysR family transcriptional regulator [Verrucomicrobiae bacterium]
MLKQATEPTTPDLRLRFRVFCGDDVALGPGKVQLLRGVRETGSIRQAAAQMQMSYMRAWGLIRTMNQCFNAPLVESARGGAQHGGARLTATGTAVLELYEQLEKESLNATRKTRQRLLALLKERSP